MAAQLGGEVTVVDRDGLGGSAVLTDCVPSKTLIATAEVMSDTAESGELGVLLGAGDNPSGQVGVDLARVNARVTALAQAQSADIAARLDREGVRVVRGLGRLDGPSRVVAHDRRAARRPSRSTPCWSRPAPTRGCCRTRSPTASGS